MAAQALLGGLPGAVLQGARGVAGGGRRDRRRCLLLLLVLPLLLLLLPLPSGRLLPRAPVGRGGGGGRGALHQDGGVLLEVLAPGGLGGDDGPGAVHPAGGAAAQLPPALLPAAPLGHVLPLDVPLRHGGLHHLGVGCEEGGMRGGGWEEREGGMLGGRREGGGGEFQ